MAATGRAFSRDTTRGTQDFIRTSTRSKLGAQFRVVHSWGSRRVSLQTKPAVVNRVGGNRFEAETTTTESIVRRQCCRKQSWTETRVLIAQHRLTDPCSSVYGQSSDHPAVPLGLAQVPAMSTRGSWRPRARRSVAGRRPVGCPRSSTALETRRFCCGVDLGVVAVQILVTSKPPRQLTTSGSGSGSP